MKIHSEKRPHICSACGKSFKWKQALKNHLRVHTGERPYVCSLCQKTYRSRSSLLYHMKAHHPQHKSFVIEAQSHQETLQKIAGERVGCKGVPISKSGSDGENISEIHDSEAPYVINVKIEENM